MRVHSSQSRHLGRRAAVSLAVVVTLSWAALPARAELRLKDICRVKGQEENTLHGLGLVVGLKGTGDSSSFLPEMQSLARLLQKMQAPVGETPAALQAALKEVKNVALVAVTATVPAAGARQGDQVDCQVMSIGSAKSLAGGRLYLTPLLGPDPNNNRVFAFAQGPIQLDDPKHTTAARVHRGCRLEEDFLNVFATKEGRVTLVLDQDHADFELAWEIADRINNESPIRGDDEQLARALDQVNIELTIPQGYRDDPVSFLAVVLSTPLAEPRTAATVFINEASGAIVIGDDVEVGSVVVSHKNVVIETGNNLPVADRFTAMHPGVSEDEFPERVTKLKALAEALNAVKVPNEDIIDIIKGLAKSGKLHGRLIVD